jgi:hypothetical protein
MTRSLLHVIRAETLLLRQGADHRLPFDGETPIRIRGGLPLLPLLHINRGQTSSVTLSSIYVLQSAIKAQRDTGIETLLFSHGKACSPGDCLLWLPTGASFSPLNRELLRPKGPHRVDRNGATRRQP